MQHARARASTGEQAPEYTQTHHVHARGAAAITATHGPVFCHAVRTDTKVWPARIRVGDQHVKLLEADLAISIGVNHSDHLVHFLVRDEFSHADQNMSDLGGADESVFVQVDKVESLTNFFVCEFGRPLHGFSVDQHDLPRGHTLGVFRVLHQ